MWLHIDHERHFKKGWEGQHATGNNLGHRGLTIGKVEDQRGWCMPQSQWTLRQFVSVMEVHIRAVQDRLSREIKLSRDRRTKGVLHDPSPVLVSRCGEFRPVLSVLYASYSGPARQVYEATVTVITFSDESIKAFSKVDLLQVLQFWSDLGYKSRWWEASTVLPLQSVGCL